MAENTINLNNKSNINDCIIGLLDKNTEIRKKLYGKNLGQYELSPDFSFSGSPFLGTAINVYEHEDELPNKPTNVFREIEGTLGRYSVDYRQIDHTDEIKYVNGCVINTFPSLFKFSYFNQTKVYSFNRRSIYNPTIPIETYKLFTEDKNRNGRGVYYIYNELNESGSPMDFMNVPTSDGMTVSTMSPNIADVNTLLYKTNTFFQTGEIQSMISKFRNQYDTDIDITQTGLDSRYGLSRGHALVREDGTETINGYSNPYCRVWTNHHQYNTFKDTIRKKGFEDNSSKDKTGVGLRPNEGEARLRHNTSLNRLTGRPIIAPEGVSDVTPEVMKKEIKKCMFSIENLAWKDVNINKAIKEGSSEKALSPSQVGPFGGRIMWFPPYNIKFSEQANAHWDSKNFIGRGEPIYTYQNSDRTGTLSFTLLVDYPSVIETTQKEPDYDDMVLRFMDGEGKIEETSKSSSIEFEKKLQREIEKSKDPIESEEGKEYHCFVFFPHNYSGYDNGENALEYLYKGLNDKIDNENGRGYEMLSGGQGLSDPGKKTLTDKDLKSNGDNRFDLNSNGFNSNISSFINDEEFKKIVNVKDPSSVLSFKEFYELISNRLIREKASKNMQNYLKTILAYEEGDSMKEQRISCTGYSCKYPGEGYSPKMSFRRAAKVSETVCRLGMDKGYVADFSNDGIKAIDAAEIDIPDVSQKIAKLGRFVHIKILLKNPMLNAAVVVADSKVPYNINEIRKTTSDEYTYFEKMSEDKTILYEKTIEKVKYFNPAFHSISPEGFNARLTFLQQCLRQGPTRTVTEKNKTNLLAGNLGFGRAPYCILKLGDFFYTKIVINNINVTYESWDLNPEGIGVQPMLADISLQFSIVGGQDISGPIERLQNAVSFNYYGNTSIYEPRSDYREDKSGKLEVWEAMLNKNEKE